MRQPVHQNARATGRSLRLWGALVIGLLVLPPAAQTLPIARAAAVALPRAFTEADFDELLAPIALYPDPLLAQVLSAATDLQQLLDAGNWLLASEALGAADRSNASTALGFGAATRSLLQFPTVVDMMCSQLDWTRQLSEAVNASRTNVLNAVQRLRRRAVALGSLTSGFQQRVISLPDGDATLVTVQPATAFIYVPIYDPRVVYAPLPSVGQGHVKVGIGVPAVARFIAFAEGVRITDAFDSEYGPDYVGASFAAYYGGELADRDRPYRPTYGKTFTKAAGYSRPTRYRYAWDGQRLRIQNGEYFRRFAGNANLMRGNERFGLASEPPVAAATPTSGQVRLSAAPLPSAP